MERYVIETPDGYVQGISYNDPEYIDDVNEAMQFETADEAWDFVDFYFTDDYDEQEALGIYVNKLEYPDEEDYPAEEKGQNGHIISTALGYVAGLKPTTRPEEREKDVVFVSRDRMHDAKIFDSAEEAREFADRYVSKYFSYMGTEAGAYVQRIPVSNAKDINVSLLNNEVDSLLDLVNDRLSSEDSLPISGSLSDLLSAASKLLGKKK